jgi:protein-disulfide isomerase
MPSMKIKTFIVPLLLALCVIAASAQRRTTPSRSAPPKPTPAPPAKPSPTPQASATQPSLNASATVAIVNDVTISDSDIQAQLDATILNDPDLYLRDFYQNRTKAIQEARQRALDARLASMLIAAHAKKLGMTSEEFLDQEINSKITPPSDAEVRAAYDANRSQLGGADLESVRPQLISYLRGQRSEQLYGALINRLKMTNTVMKHADVNTPNLAPGTVLASVNGQPIRIEAINERMKAYIYKLEMRIYSARKEILNRRINDLLIVAEANKRKIGPEEIVRTEINDKVKPPTDAEVTKFYEDNKSRITGDFATVRPQIVSYLEQQQQEKLETALAERLRAGNKVQLLLKEPNPPVQVISLGNGPSRGDLNAPVTIVEFTDFQCSACGGMYPIIEDTLKPYGSRIHFVIRNFPLTSIHANAFRAAQAAAAANAQGKFWEYIDYLFKNQTALDVDSLKKYAAQVGLDRKRFDAEFESGKYDEQIRQDITEGEMYGVESTPTIFVNGVVLTEFSADGLKAAIDRAMARTAR